MLVGQLIVSIFVAMAVTVLAVASGWSLLWALPIYSLSGSLTLVLLAALTAIGPDPLLDDD